MKAARISFEQLADEAKRMGAPLPIEQTKVWMDYEATIPGRTPWGGVAVSDGDKVVAVAAFADYETHGYHYLRSHHGPVWASAPTPELEGEALAAIKELVKSADSHVAFIRLSVMADLPCCKPTLSMLPYDYTVVMDLTGGDEEILNRMKPRGRRDVRKSLRECKATFADETAQATKDFSEYYEVMEETAERDGFSPAPKGDYEDMLRILGPDHCRLFCGRTDGQVTTWTISTMSDNCAVRYYGASRSGADRALATDGLIYFEACELGRLGCVSYDHMGIGSDFSPHLNSLTTFKTKFAKEGVTQVAPDRDLPVKDAFYSALMLAKKLRKR